MGLEQCTLQYTRGGTALVFVLRNMPVKREEKNITLSINYNKESQCQMNWGCLVGFSPGKATRMTNSLEGQVIF